MEDVTYLWVAETVLRKHKRPLNARALVNYGLEDGLFPAHGLSHTPQKSMQARLSMDILNNKDSIFVRTQRGRFFLRELMPSGQLNGYDGLRVYTAERRALAPATEMVLCIPRQYYIPFLDYQGIDHVGQPNPLFNLKGKNIEFISRSIAELNDDYKQVITYTVIQYQSKILSFRRGLYNRSANFLRGALCVGFGGHVNEDDRDLFSLHEFGIRQNAVREISEELMLPDGRPNIDPDALEFLGILNDDSSDVGVRHMAVVLRYWVDDWGKWRDVAKGEASINKLKWIDTVGENINLSDFEYWSQLVVRKYFPNSMAMVPSFKIQKRSAFREPHILCVVGSIGSGKSATSRLFVQKFNYTMINSGKVLASLIGVPPVPDTSRSAFQISANDFISQAHGPNELGGALAKAASETGVDRVLIDGIRHPETLEALKQQASMPVALLYVYTPPDTAFEMYRYREGHAEEDTTFQEFVKLYTAPVESKIRYLIGEADIITFNWLGLDAYERAITALMEELHVDRS